MQTTAIEIEGLVSLITSSVDRLLAEIDPTIEKFQNVTIEILFIIEDRIRVNVSETLYWLETNLFVLLFAAIVFFILVFIFLNLLDILLVRYGYSPAKRRLVGLIVITIIFVWLFIAMILSTWPPENKFDLQTLKYVLFGLLAVVVLYLIIVWIYYLYRTFREWRSRCEDKELLIRGTPPTNEQDNIELDNVRL